MCACARRWVYLRLAPSHRPPNVRCSCQSDQHQVVHQPTAYEIRVISTGREGALQAELYALGGHTLCGNAGVSVTTINDLVRDLVAAAPELEALLREHLVDYEELLPHVFFG